jgi:hypothetical protein
MTFRWLAFTSFRLGDFARDHPQFAHKQNSQLLCPLCSLMLSSQTLQVGSIRLSNDPTQRVRLQICPPLGTAATRALFAPFAFFERFNHVFTLHSSPLTLHSSLLPSTPIRGRIRMSQERQRSPHFSLFEWPQPNQRLAVRGVSEIMGAPELGNSYRRSARCTVPPLSWPLSAVDSWSRWLEGVHLNVDAIERR